MLSFLPLVLILLGLNLLPPVTVRVYGQILSCGLFQQWNILFNSSQLLLQSLLEQVYFSRFVVMIQAYSFPITGNIVVNSSAGPPPDHIAFGRVILSFSYLFPDSDMESQLSLYCFFENHFIPLFL